MQPMKESIVTILHGIKAWGDASISRLREDLQRQIRAVRQTAELYCTRCCLIRQTVIFQSRWLR